MWNRQDLKARGKTAFKMNYWRSVLCAFLLMVLTAGATFSGSTSANGQEGTEGMDQALQDLEAQDPGTTGLIAAGALAALSVVFIICFILKVFVFNPLEVGCFGFFRENVRSGATDLGVIKTGFQNYGHTFVTLLLRDIFLLLWACLFIFPAFIKIYSYRMVPFILRDHPELSATEVITYSRKMMDGHKWNTFVLDLSFIGWYILGGLTCGLVNLFWTEPYRQNANAALYLRLSGEM